MHVTFIFRLFSISILLAASLPSHIIIKIDFKKIFLLRICHRASKRRGGGGVVRPTGGRKFHSTIQSIHPSGVCVCVCISIVCESYRRDPKVNETKRPLAFFYSFVFLHANNILKKGKKEPRKDRKMLNGKMDTGRCRLRAVVSRPPTFSYKLSVRSIMVRGS